MMTRTALAVLAIVVALTVAALADKNCSTTGSGKCCTETSFGKCFSVHGRYAIYVENNGIWAISQKRLLLTAGDGDLDQMIYDRGDWQDFDLVGDFTVCPLSRFKQGHRQSVCVQGYRNLKMMRRPVNH
jgi:hypothetical protein